MPSGAIITTLGLDKLASATPLNQLNISALAVGDGNGGYPTLDPSMTALANEVWRGTPSPPIRDPNSPNVLIFEAVIPPSVGGFTVREQAIFDDAGDMIAIGQTSVVEKPLPNAATGVMLTVRLHMQLDNAEQVDLFFQDAPIISAGNVSNANGGSVQDFIDDYDGFTDALLAEAGIVDDGQPDTVVESQRVDALNNLYETMKNVFRYGAKGDGVTNDTAAFSGARAVTGGSYFIPSGTYVLDGAFDVWADPFTSGDNVTLIIDGVPFDASRCFVGQLQAGPVNSTIVNIKGARSGVTIFRISDGSAPGQSHQAYLPWDIRRDSHSFIMSPATNGGQCDTLWRRSAQNPDPFGNRFSFDFSEGTTSDTLNFTYATSATGFPNFDSYMLVTNGVSPALDFPAIKPSFRKGFSVKTRSGHTFDYNHGVTAGLHTISDTVTGRTLATVDASGFSIGNKKQYAVGVTDIQASSGNHALSTSISLSAAVPTVYKLSASGQRVAGTLRLVAISSGGSGFGVRHIAFQSDGTTVATQVIGVDNLVSQFHADLSLVSGVLQLALLYDGGLGGAGRFSFSAEWDSY